MGHGDPSVHQMVGMVDSPDHDRHGTAEAYGRSRLREDRQGLEDHMLVEAVAGCYRLVRVHD